MSKATICDKCQKILKCRPSAKIWIDFSYNGEVEYELCEECKQQLHQWLTGNTPMARVLKLLEQYDDLSALALNNYCIGQDCKALFTSLRSEKEKLTKELIDHGCRRKN